MILHDESIPVSVCVKGRRGVLKLMKMNAHGAIRDIGQL